MSKSTIKRTAIQTFKIFKVFGFASFTIENGKLVSKPIDFLFFGVNIFIAASLLFLAIKFRAVFLKSESELTEYGNYIAYIASNITDLLMMILSFLVRHEVWSIAVELSKIDQKLEAIEFFEDFSKIRRNTLLVFLFIMLWSIPLVWVFYIADGSLFKAVLFMYSGFYFMVCSGSVVGFMIQYYLRLKTINKICDSMLEHSTCNVRTMNSEHIDDYALIRTMIEVYEKLVKVNDSINICYGVPTMLSFAVLFCYSNFTNFMAFKNFRNNGKLESLTIASILVSFYLHVFSISVIYVCCLAEREARKTLKLSNNILNHSKDQMKVALLTAFNDLIARNTPKFTCGLFDFDWKLIYGVSVYFDVKK